jgi:hypothetical protein
VPGGRDGYGPTPGGVDAKPELAGGAGGAVATRSTRSRNVAISQRAISGWWANPMSLAQATRSAAARMISSQAALAVRPARRCAGGGRALAAGSSTPRNGSLVRAAVSDQGGQRWADNAVSPVGDDQIAIYCSSRAKLNTADMR